MLIHITVHNQHEFYCVLHAIKHEYPSVHWASGAKPTDYLPEIQYPFTFYFELGGSITLTICRYVEKLYTAKEFIKFVYGDEKCTCCCQIHCCFCERID